MLFAVALLDELSSGVPSGGAPDIERAFGLSHAATAAVLFLVPGAVWFVLDPVWFWLAERLGRQSLVRGGLAVMAAASFVAAVAPGPATLAGALSIWGMASGAAKSLTEVALIDGAPERQAQTMARWSLLALVGDFAAPLLLGAIALIAPGAAAWRWGFVLVGGVVALWAGLLSLRAFPEAIRTRAPEDGDEPTLWQAARAAIGDRVLLLWLLGAALCDLLDEILVVFASLHVREVLGASPAAQSAMIGAFVAGGAIGLVALERLLARRSERGLLIAAGCGSIAALAAWLAAPTVWLAVALMVPLGAAAAPLHPLATARAYARCPGQASAVLVAGHLFAPLTLALPWLLGWVADRAGTFSALALLGVQPIALVILAVTRGDRGNRDSRTACAR